MLWGNKLEVNSIQDNMSAGTPIGRTILVRLLGVGEFEKHI